MAGGRVKRFQVEGLPKDPAGRFAALFAERERQASRGVHPATAARAGVWAASVSIAAFERTPTGRTWEWRSGSVGSAVFVAMQCPCCCRMAPYQLKLNCKARLADSRGEIRGLHEASMVALSLPSVH